MFSRYRGMGYWCHVHDKEVSHILYGLLTKEQICAGMVGCVTISLEDHYLEVSFDEKRMRRFKGNWTILVNVLHVESLLWSSSQRFREPQLWAGAFPCLEE